MGRIQTADIAGQRFGRLIVLYKTDILCRHDYFWECVCDCGKYKKATAGNLRHNNVRSCGCLIGEASITHGDSSKRIRHIWFAMMSRCYNKNNNRYKYYGEKGISVCEQWKEYQDFKKWAYENGYSDELSLDRFPDLNKGYFPENCRWATAKEQGNNKTNNKIFIIDGISKTLQQWSDLYGINQSRILRRIKAGWDIKPAITQPTDQNKISNRYRHANK